MTTRVNAARLLDLAAAVYAGAGMPEADARLVADTLVQADLWGHQSHGVLRLGWYLDRIRNGVMKPVTTPEFVVDAGAVAVIDGHDGVGHVLTELARKEAVRRARLHGIAVVGVRMSNHFGTCMYYTRLGALDGCVMLLTSNGGPAMAPWGGRKKIIGTNPWSVAAPAGKCPPLLVDMAATGSKRITMCATVVMACSCLRILLPICGGLRRKRGWRRRCPCDYAKGEQ